MIRNYLHWLCGTYGFENGKEFLLSVCPSFKYDIQSVTIPLSIVTGIITSILGIGPILAFAMFIAILVETWTGIKASLAKRKESFDSFKFSRCVIKICVWLTIIFIVHSFSMDCAAHTGWMYALGSYFFDFVKLAVLTYFLVEYMTSILENLSVIDGKPKDALITAIKERWLSIIDLLKKK